MESLAVRIADAPVVEIDGRWQRHVAAAFADQAFTGYAAYGRWGTKAGFPVLYLARPLESVIVEAYRRLVDPVEDPELVGQIKPRILITCEVRLARILDLRSAGARLLVGLAPDELHSEINDRDAYAKCQRVAQVAHQLGLHGLIAPAATQLGDTLVVFTDALTDAEHLRRSEPDTLWDTLPADPRQATRLSRHLRAVE